jgi:two-component system phosphate regulon response regulator OmpR
MTTDSKSHILVVDDDTRLRDLLKQFLRDQGLSVTVATDAQDARRKLALFQFDLIVLDVMMPGETGVEFARTLAQNAPPVLLLTAMAQADDRIVGLEAGADDYLVKPFEPRELVLRIQAILRRTVMQAQRGMTVSFGDYRFDCVTLRLQKEGKVLALTTGESQLLGVLAKKAGVLVPRAELAQVLGTGASERSVDVQMSRLRKKIETDSSKPIYIQTVRGSGYILHTEGNG